MKSKKPQSKTVYDRERKARDPLYKAFKVSRTLLSSNLRRYLKNGRVNSQKLSSLLGMDATLFFEELVTNLEARNGLYYSVAKDYGHFLELDHVIPLATLYPLQNQGLSIDAILRIGFTPTNIRLVERVINRNHTRNKAGQIISEKNMGKPKPRKSA